MIITRTGWQKALFRLFVLMDSLGSHPWWLPTVYRIKSKALAWHSRPSQPGLIISGSLPISGHLVLWPLSTAHCVLGTLHSFTPPAKPFSLLFLLLSISSFRFPFFFISVFFNLTDPPYSKGLTQMSPCRWSLPWLT